MAGYSQPGDRGSVIVFSPTTSWLIQSWFFAGIVNPNDIFNNDAYHNSWAPSLNASGVNKSYGSVSSRCYGVNIGGLLVLAQTPSYTHLVPQVSGAVDEWALSTHMTYSGGGLEQLETHYSAFIASYWCF